MKLSYGQEFKFRKIQLLILSFLILILTIITSYADDSIPIGRNRTKEFVDDFFQPGILKNELYVRDLVDAGPFYRKLISRKDLEAGEVAVFRFGNPKQGGGSFPESTWATIEIERFISEYLEDHDIDPTIPDEELDKKTLDKKNQLKEECRQEFVGYTIGEQRRKVQEAWENEEKKLGRPLDKSERDRIQKSKQKEFPTFPDPQVDETEGIAIVNNVSILDVYKIFADRDEYMNCLPENFLYSHVLTTDELKRRLIKVNLEEELLFARFEMASINVDYTSFNEGKLDVVPVTLKRPDGTAQTTLPRATVAWTIDPRFNDDGKFVPIKDSKGKIIGHNGKFGHREVYVMDGLLELEPYISKDAQGFESIDESRVIAVYHTYMRVVKDTTSFPPNIRENLGREFMKKMMALVPQFMKK